MNAVGMFVHLYHVWAVFGAITAFIYGRNLHRIMRAERVRLWTVPMGLVGIFARLLRQALRDWVNLFKGVVAGFTGMPWTWPSDENMVWPLSRHQTLMVGITLGGASRLLTAVYWAERNTGWMTQETVWVPAIPIAMAVIADSHHHYVAWEQTPWRLRLLGTLALAWVLVGAFLR
jgi:hypothetical protein